jgi:hypothetical protein
MYPDSFLANMRLLILYILYKRRDDPRAAAQAERVAKLDAQRPEKASAMLCTIRVQRYLAAKDYMSSRSAMLIAGLLLEAPRLAIRLSFQVEYMRD